MDWYAGMKYMILVLQSACWINLLIGTQGLPRPSIQGPQPWSDFKAQSNSLWICCYGLNIRCAPVFTGTFILQVIMQCTKNRRILNVQAKKLQGRQSACHSTIRSSLNRSSVASRNSEDMCRLPLGHTSLHWAQKTHWVTHILTRFVSGMNSMAFAGQTLMHILHPIQESRS